MRVRSLLASAALTGAAVLGAVAPAEAAPTNDTTQDVGALAVVHVVLYQHSNYGGASFTLNGDYGCDTNPDVDWQLGSYSPSGWNDMVSSFLGYSSCETRVWEHDNYGGANYGAYTNSGYVGDAMNDKTSSSQNS
ncbi:hypothetical protein PV379_41955 [Streptomyces caniscabiei]|uniref:hypothetical protein n=1 Tax=Streptomyces TaxID=1883 RepID=UPI0029BE4FCF|nr:hypothetical protein [Streptomyces caniscabiei]MDX2604323.1 hypothetical protein [Streptomyces caniscabiei]MDX2735665.1 hypothetical protein [Streptomyces caniscabiei]MDX2783829.1 hypothetical protein [Streptomyces caniscabiei]